jgi:hypothetical protein
MPSLNMQTAHALGQDEAMRRLKDKFSVVRGNYSAHVSDLSEVWKENILSFGFKAAGMKVSGTVTVGDSSVQLAAQLPFAAMMFKGMIEKQIRAELGELLT